MPNESINPVQSLDYALNNAVPALLAALPATIKVKLFKSGPGTISTETAVGDFTEATFAGYATKVITTATDLTLAVSPNQNAATLISAIVWIAGAVVAPGETVQGYFVTDATDTLLYQSEFFPLAIAVTSFGQVVDLLLQIPFLMVGSLS